MDVGPKFLLIFIVVLGAAFVFFSMFAPDVIRGMGLEPIEMRWDLY